MSQLPAAAGQFPQISGLTMTVDRSAPIGKRVRDVTIGGQPLEPNKTYRVAVPDFMMKGGDNYDMFAGQRVATGPEAGEIIVAALERYVTTRRDIAPQVDGRITIVR